MALDDLLRLTGPSSGVFEEDISATGDGPVVFAGKDRSFTGFLRVGGDVTGTNPTLDVLIKESEDGLTSWVTIATFAQVTDEQVGYIATATPRYEVPGEDPLVVGMVTTKDYIQAVWTIGGTVSPTFNDVSIELQPVKGFAQKRSGT